MSPRYGMYGSRRGSSGARGTMGPPWWAGRFRGCGYRWTMPREVILDTLIKAKKHLSAEDVYIQVHKVYPNVGLTTVYRTLEILVQMGMIHKFDFGDGRARYELAQGAKGAATHHHHLVCTHCGRVIDYADLIDEEKDLIERTQKKLIKKFNFKINDHIIRFQGVCDRCQRST